MRDKRSICGLFMTVWCFTNKIYIEIEYVRYILVNKLHTFISVTKLENFVMSYFFQLVLIVSLVFLPFI